MGLDEIKSRLTSHYVRQYKLNTEEREGKETEVQQNTTATQPSQTQDMGDDLLTQNPQAILNQQVMSDLGFQRPQKSGAPQLANSKGTPTDVDISDQATTARLQRFETSPQMTELKEMFNIETQNPFLAGINLSGLDPDKLNKYMAKDLDNTTTANFMADMDKFALLG